MVDEPTWEALTDEQLRGAARVFLSAFAIALAILLLAAMPLGSFDVDEGDTGLESSVYGLYARGTVSDLQCDDRAGVCSYRRGRYACTYDGGTRPHCSLTASRRSDPAPAGR